MFTFVCSHFVSVGNLARRGIARACKYSKPGVEGFAIIWEFASQGKTIINLEISLGLLKVGWNSSPWCHFISGVEILPENRALKEYFS